MALEMELSNLCGNCDKCGEYEWLYKRDQKYYCGYCIQEHEHEQNKAEVMICTGCGLWQHDNLSHICRDCGKSTIPRFDENGKPTGYHKYSTKNTK